MDYNFGWKLKFFSIGTFMQTVKGPFYKECYTITNYFLSFSFKIKYNMVSYYQFRLQLSTFITKM
jgi:hypothetical protein